jgi:hypothetical protein
MSLGDSVELVAERALTCVKSNGNRIPVNLRIGKPVAASGGDWMCSVEASGLLDRPREIYGIDSFQALMLGQGLLKHLVRGEIESGSTFLAFRPEEPITYEEIFGKDI